MSEGIHCLKTWPYYFQATLEGRQRFELRNNDRPFEVGCRLVQHEWDAAAGAYTGRTQTVEVTFILQGGAFDLPDHLCVMSTKLVETPRTMEVPR